MSNGNDPTQQSSLPSPPPSSLPSPSPSSLPSPPPASNVDTSTSSPPPISSLPSPPSFSPPAPPSTSTPSTGSDPSSSSKPSSHTPTHSSTTTTTTTTTKNGSTSTSDSSSATNDVSTGLVAGLAVGGVVLLVFITLFFLCCRGRSKKKRRPDDDELHVRPPKGETHGGEVHGWQHNVPPPTDHVVQLQPRISPPPAHASRPPLPPLPPPPPPPIFSSTGDSGSNYSGSENPLPPPSPSLFLGLSKSTFTFEELMLATGGFSDANLLGQGGFGYVHRGMLPNGKEIAVKQLKSGSGQGDREFQAEVETISRVHHKHLVSLVGYCIARNKRLLVYEFVPNNTLEFHLHGKGRPCLDWSTRLKIALGSAKGLAYLHEDCNPKIIHRDIKSANILLDFKFEPKVADFGLAKFSSDNNTHVSTRVMGTFGYMAPEYASSGKLTEKSDVFSYGVMLLELITGNRPVDTTNSYTDDSLVDWARPLLTRAIEEENYSILSDPRLQQSYNNNEMARCVACAAACVRHSAKRRPRMSQVVRALEGDASLDNLNDGVKPGHSSAYGSYGSSDYDQYQEEMKRFRKLALGGQEYPGDEFDDATRGYVQHPPGSSNGVPAAREMSSTTTRNARLASRGFR